MTHPIITVEHLGKYYKLGRSPEKYQSLRDTLAGQVRRMRRGLVGKRRTSPSLDEGFWALDDLSFSIQQGDRIGVIGRNGAGKSTLLKILSRITEPTRGEIRIRGRVASLLEVGTGFHPELTGRENIYLNGAVLGMGKAEIRRKFDEIVAFAEVERFLDTPVKRYSSGMYVRLAFSVAAHLEPEILIVDEVLAVGDAQFQNKCLGKMKNVSQSGRTVLFVSHNMAAIRQLCNTGILLKQGQLATSGTIDEVISHYLQSVPKGFTFAGKTSPHGITLTNAAILDAQTHKPLHAITFDRDYSLQLNFQAEQPITNTAVVVRIYDSVGTLVSSLCTPEEGIAPFLLKDNTEIKFYLPHLSLYPGKYTASVFVYRSSDPAVYLEAEEAFGFEVHPAIINDAMWAYRPDHGIVRISSGGQVHRSENNNLALVAVSQSTK